MKNIKELRCVHRHTINEHPQCFTKGLVRYPDVKAFEKYSGQPWYQYPDYRIGYFDIECDNLKVDFSTLLSWVIKDKDGDYISSVITKDEMFNGKSDYRLVNEFIDALSNYSIIIGYYSSKFDMPYMRAKALHYGLNFPGYGEIYHWDLYYTAKAKLTCLSSRSLDNVCNYLGISGKTPIDKDIWRRAKYGDPKALDEVLYHNEQDVKITEELHNRLEFTRKWNRTSI